MTALARLYDEIRNGCVLVDALDEAERWDGVFTPAMTDLAESIAETLAPYSPGQRNAICRQALACASVRPSLQPKRPA